VVICGDTGVTPAAITLAQDADVLVHEATFMENEAERAQQVAHSTAAQAAKVAREAGVKTLILTHFSPRYESHDQSQMEALLAEAQAIFPNTQLAYDFWSFEV
jgi:ribonuclease Z